MLGQCRGGSIGGYEMRQEMRKLNRAKYAHTVEEMVQLSAQGYVPVGTAAADPPDAVSGQPAADSVSQLSADTFGFPLIWWRRKILLW